MTENVGNGADCPVLMEQIECNTQECRALLSSYVLYRVTSSNEITSFVWLQFRDEVAATLELNANRVQFVAVKAGSTIVEYKLYDAEGWLLSKKEEKNIFSNSLKFNQRW